MNKLIFGSTAIKYWFPDFPRTPKDVDYMSKEGKMEKQEQHYWVDTFQELMELNGDPDYLDPDLILTVKSSHFGWNIHWDKTLNDILFLKKNGCQLDRRLYKKLVKDWIGVHGKAWASLSDKSADEFFADAVNRKYNHDKIHEAVATYDEPLYHQILQDPHSGSVKCSEKKFNVLSTADRTLLVKEEIWVTALERYLIPNDFKYSVNLAYHRSLKKLVTTMSSGWFKMWIIENFDLLYGERSTIFIDKFKKAEEQGKL